MQVIPQIAVLITCHNRKENTLKCLESVYSQRGIGEIFKITVFLTDDGSSDGTASAVIEKFQDVHIIKGNGNLFWAGGTREAWKEAIRSNISIDYYLLLNDDVVLFDKAIESLLKDKEYINTDEIILISSTVDATNNTISYGGRILLNNHNMKTKKVIPNNKSPQLCHMGNGNIMLISGTVYSRIGMLSERYTHGIADYEYTLRARKAGIPTYVGSHAGGKCFNDHGNNWEKWSNVPLKKRIAQLYDVKGFAYKEYLYFIKSYFPVYLPKAWALSWLKTFFPFFWKWFKK